MTKSLEEEEEKEEEGIDEANTFLYTVYLKLKKNISLLIFRGIRK